LSVNPPAVPPMMRMADVLAQSRGTAKEFFADYRRKLKNRCAPGVGVKV